jgi:predicted Zn-dependent protease
MSNHASRFALATILFAAAAFNSNPGFACAINSVDLLQSGVRPAPIRCGGGYNTAMQLTYEKNWTGAIAALNAQMANKRAPVNGDLLELLGYLLAQAGDNPAAIDSYRKAVALEPDRFSAHFRLGVLYAQTGHVAEAEKELAEMRTACGGCGGIEKLEAAIAKGR